MTTVYFIRHAQADSTVLDQKSRPLTQKGTQDSLLLSEKFALDKIDVIFSSPYKRAQDTVLHLAKQQKLTVNIVKDFRGLKLQSEWIDNYRNFFLKYWNNFEYHYADGESFAQLQSRSVAALQKIVSDNKEKTIIICTHSVLIAVVLKYYNNTFNFEDFMKIAESEPYVIKIELDENCCTLPS